MTPLLLALLTLSADLDAPVSPEAALVELRGDTISAGLATDIKSNARFIGSAHLRLSSAVVQARAGVETQPLPWLAIRVDAGPIFGVAPLDLGASVRALATAAWRPDPFVLFAGPLIDLGGSFGGRGLRTHALVTSGAGARLGPATLLVVADLGYTFTAKDTGSLRATIGVALQWQFAQPPRTDG